MPRGRKKRVHDTFTENPQPFLLPETEFDYVDKAVERVKIAWGFHHMMNPDGKPMLMAFSGGKDSICLFFICKKASEELGIPMEQMFHVQYNVTNVDPPELYRFIRDVMKKQYPFIEIHHPKKTMWQLIVEKHLPPLRATRYCCAELKEISHVKGGYTLTGVRHAESPKRANRESIEIRGKNRKDAVYLGDNVEDEREIRYCMQTESYICNPIIDWSDEDVWRFIRRGGIRIVPCTTKDGIASAVSAVPLVEKSTREETSRHIRITRSNTYGHSRRCWMSSNPRGGGQPAHKGSAPFSDGQDVLDWWTRNPAFKEKHQDVFGKTDLFDGFEEEP